MAFTRRLYIARAPSFSSLEVHVARYEVHVNEGAGLQSLKAKCRELARSDSGLLVSPTTEALKTSYGSTSQLTVWIMTKVGYIKNSKTLKVLNNLQLKLERKTVLSHQIFQACYHFTLIARLAPKWNRVLSWLVQGCEFLSEGKGQAIDLQVGLTNEEITVTVSVIKLSFSFMKTEDLLTTSSLLNTFKTDPKCVISESSIYNNRCFLLPNFTMGYIYSASHFLPLGKEFQTYDQVRLHWKKQHGIILPEKENLFYQIFFRGNPQKFFSYPGSCVYKNRPIHYPNRDTDQVATSFIADLHARLPTVCGEPVRYSSHAHTPHTTLQPSSVSGLSHANLKRLPLPTSKLQPSVCTQNIPSCLQAVPEPSQVVPDVQTSNLFNGVRIVPIFKPRVSVPSKQKVTMPQFNRQLPVIPRFKPTAPTRAASQLLGKRPLAHSGDTTKRPCIEPTSSISVSRIQPHSQQTTSTQCRTTQQSNSSSTIISAPRHLPHPLPVTLPSTANQTVPDMSQSLRDITDEDDFLPSKVPSVHKGKSGSSGKASKKQPVQAMQSNAVSGPVFTGVGPDILKKINKAKTALLKKWLTENGVKYRSKEKKEDLVRIVVQHLTSTGKSFELNTLT